MEPTRMSDKTYVSENSMALPVRHWLGKQLAKVSNTPMPKVYSGKGSLRQLGAVTSEFKVSKPLLVTDKDLVRIGLVQRVKDALDSSGIPYAVYDKVVPNPHHLLVEEGYKVYKSNNCDGIIAIGGGSPMDCAKVIGAKVLNPKPVEEYVGLFKVGGPLPSGRDKYPPLIAIPTTAGTGSETTVAAVISFKDKNIKLAVADQALVPRAAILDPEVTATLPKHITAATGMDAMTHAVESYLSQWQNEFTKKYSLRAIERIGKFLLPCYENGNDLRAREEMLLASFEAGVAFTRANVGYVHAIAHTFGGKFHTPHGVANSMVLPLVLDFYSAKGGSHVVDRFCEMATAIGLASEYEYETRDENAKFELARAFISKIREMNASMNIPTSVRGMKASDVNAVATRALEEGHGQAWWNLLDLGYPCPVYMSFKDCTAIVRACLEPQSRL